MKNFIETKYTHTSFISLSFGDNCAPVKCVYLGRYCHDIQEAA